MAALAGVVMEVVVCANETLHESIVKVYDDPEGHCAKAQEAGCTDGEELDVTAFEGDGAFGRRLSKGGNMTEDCDFLNGKCACDLVGKLAAMEPPMEDQLPKCCDPIKDMESTPFMSGMAEQGAEICLGIVQNISVVIREAEKNCSSGLSLNMTNHNPAEDAVQQFMDMDIGKVWQPSHPVITDMAAYSTAAGGGAVLLLAAALVLRRNLRKAGDAKQRNLFSNTVQDPDVDIE